MSGAGGGLSFVWSDSEQAGRDVVSWGGMTNVEPPVSAGGG